MLDEPLWQPPDLVYYIHFTNHTTDFVSHTGYSPWHLHKNKKVKTKCMIYDYI